MNGRCHGGHCSIGGEVGSFLLLHLLVLLTLGCEQFAVDEKGLVFELGLVLEVVPVSVLMVLHSVLQNHDL